MSLNRLKPLKLTTSKLGTQAASLFPLGALYLLYRIPTLALRTLNSLRSNRFLLVHQWVCPVPSEALSDLTLAVPLTKYPSQSLGDLYSALRTRFQISNTLFIFRSLCLFRGLFSNPFLDRLWISTFRPRIDRPDPFSIQFRTRFQHRNPLFDFLSLMILFHHPLRETIRLKCPILNNWSKQFQPKNLPKIIFAFFWMKMLSITVNFLSKLSWNSMKRLSSLPHVTFNLSLLMSLLQFLFHALFLQMQWIHHHHHHHHHHQYQQQQQQQILLFQFHMLWIGGHFLHRRHYLLLIISFRDKTFWFSNTFLSIFWKRPSLSGIHLFIVTFRIKMLHGTCITTTRSLYSFRPVSPRSSNFLLLTSLLISMELVPTIQNPIQLSAMGVCFWSTWNPIFSLNRVPSFAIWLLRLLDPIARWPSSICPIGIHLPAPLPLLILTRNASTSPNSNENSIQRISTSVLLRHSIHAI